MKEDCAAAANSAEGRSDLIIAYNIHGILLACKHIGTCRRCGVTPTTSPAVDTATHCRQWQLQRSFDPPHAALHHHLRCLHLAFKASIQHHQHRLLGACLDADWSAAKAALLVTASWCFQQLRLPPTPSPLKACRAALHVDDHTPQAAAGRQLGIQRMEAEGRIIIEGAGEGVAAVKGGGGEDELQAALHCTAGQDDGARAAQGCRLLCNRVKEAGGERREDGIALKERAVIVDLFKV